MAKDFTKRVKSTQRAACTTAGWQNDFVHLSGTQNNYPVTPTGGYVLHRVVFGTAASGTVVLKVGSDTMAVISSTNASKDTGLAGIYLYDQLFYSGDGDVTFVISKG